MENTARWLLLECLPVYLLPALAVIFLTVFGPYDLHLAFAQAVTGTDFFAGSFAFLYVMAFKKEMAIKLRSQIYVALIIMALLFIGVKLSPIALPVSNNCCDDLFNSRAVIYFIFSIFAFFWTFSLAKKVSTDAA
jgi:hypothetical protein